MSNASSTDHPPTVPFGRAVAPSKPQQASEAYRQTLEQASRLEAGGVAGQYLLTSCTEHRTRYGAPFLKCRLEDSSDQMAVYVWETSGLIELVRSLAAPAAVQTVFSTRLLNGQTIGDLQAIFAIEDVEVINAAQLLPRSACPECALSALRSVAELVDSLSSPNLRRFLNRVLLDGRIGRPLLTCRASQTHHHADPGGLLVHSVEVMESCTTSLACSKMSALELDITRIAALLHDIGKVRTVGSGRVRPVHCKLVRHETQTNRLLEPHLEWLRTRDPSAAAGLDYIFDFLAQPAGSRAYARFVGAELVADADHQSTAFANRRRLCDLLEQTMPRGHSRVAHLRDVTAELR